MTFRDITPLLADPRGLAGGRRRRSCRARRRPGSSGSTSSPAIEARGFILGAPLAVDLGVGFVPVRKQGKLPGDVHAETYDLEYGTADARGAGRRRRVPDHRVLLVDDVLATGGTAAAAVALLRAAGAERGRRRRAHRAAGARRSRAARRPAGRGAARL